MEYACEVCKTAHATLHLTAVEGGKAFERHFCESCSHALKVGVLDLLPSFPVQGAGAWIEEQRKLLLCAACGHRNQDDWKFCSSCGAKRGP